MLKSVFQKRPNLKICINCVEFKETFNRYRPPSGGYSPMEGGKYSARGNCVRERMFQLIKTQPCGSGVKIM